MKFACFSETRAPPIVYAFEAAGLDQPGGVIARRVAETLPALGSCSGCVAMRRRQQFADPLARGGAVARREAKPGRGEDFVAGRVGAAHWR